MFVIIGAEIVIGLVMDNFNGHNGHLRAWLEDVFCADELMKIGLEQEEATIYQCSSCSVISTFAQVSRLDKVFKNNAREQSMKGSAKVAFRGNHWRSATTAASFNNKDREATQLPPHHLFTGYATVIETLDLTRISSEEDGVRCEKKVQILS